MIHDSYLINLAAPPSEVRENSVAAFTGEMERALLIGAEYLVAHPGNYKGLSIEHSSDFFRQSADVAGKSAVSRVRSNA